MCSSRTVVLTLTVLTVCVLACVDGSGVDRRRARPCDDHPELTCQRKSKCGNGWFSGECPGATYCCKPAVKYDRAAQIRQLENEVKATQAVLDESRVSFGDAVNDINAQDFIKKYHADQERKAMISSIVGVITGPLPGPIGKLVGKVLQKGAGKVLISQAVKKIPKKAFGFLGENIADFANGKLKGALKSGFKQTSSAEQKKLTFNEKFHSAVVTAFAEVRTALAAKLGGYGSSAAEEAMTKTYGGTAYAEKKAREAGMSLFDYYNDLYHRTRALSWIGRIENADSDAEIRSIMTEARAFLRALQFGVGLKQYDAGERKTAWSTLLKKAYSILKGLGWSSGRGMTSYRAARKWEIKGNVLAFVNSKAHPGQSSALAVVRMSVDTEVGDGHPTFVVKEYVPAPIAPIVASFAVARGMRVLYLPRGEYKYWSTMRDMGTGHILRMQDMGLIPKGGRNKKYEFYTLRAGRKALGRRALNIVYRKKDRFRCIYDAASGMTYRTHSIKGNKYGTCTPDSEDTISNQWFGHPRNAQCPQPKESDRVTSHSSILRRLNNPRWTYVPCGGPIPKNGRDFQRYGSTRVSSCKKDCFCIQKRRGHPGDLYLDWHLTSSCVCGRRTSVWRCKFDPGYVHGFMLEGYKSMYHPWRKM
eukprot:TRINITY_DN745_c0_g1_i1.p1 TRINITY_DN745_c0_g1~~TRINITY_DN745_c0_g1_i1.p1  ORF type:complete len:645 (-),score=103.50 TRINITY_DN745_c0_g1_i1:210-2144(-)